MDEFIRRRLEDLFADDFRSLRRIPCSTVWRTIGYLKSLTDAQRAAVLDECVSITRQNLESACGLGNRESRSGATEAARPQLAMQVLSTPSQWSEFPDRFLAQMAGDANTIGQMVDENRVTQILSCRPPVVARAPAIRKVLHKQLKDTFDAELHNHRGGEWVCRGVVNESEFGLYLDYGGRGGGIRYGVRFEPLPGGEENVAGLTLESTFGIQPGTWDFVLVDELNQLGELMTEIVTELEQLRSEVARIALEA